MKIDLTNPFMVQEWIRRGIASAREDLTGSLAHPAAANMKEDALKSIQSMERSLMSLNGICDLHLDQEHRRELAKIPWWRIGKRLAFERNEYDWKDRKRDELFAEALDVESFEL